MCSGWLERSDPILFELILLLLLSFSFCKQGNNIRSNKEHHACYPGKVFPSLHDESERSVCASWNACIGLQAATSASSLRPNTRMSMSCITASNAPVPACRYAFGLFELVSQLLFQLHMTLAIWQP